MNYRFAVALAYVTHGDAGIDTLVALQYLSRQGNFRQAEIGIAQPITEGIKRTRRLVEVLRRVVARAAWQVGPAGVQVTVVIRNLSYRAWKGGG
ncbi:hypothetical protein D3C86_1755830 [compost metagenome]